MDKASGVERKCSRCPANPRKRFLDGSSIAAMTARHCLKVAELVVDHGLPIVELAARFLLHTDVTKFG